VDIDRINKYLLFIILIFVIFFFIMLFLDWFQFVDYIPGVGEGSGSGTGAILDYVKFLLS
jgi:hypothetical protein